MELSEIQKKLAEFEKTLKPVKKGETTLKAALEKPAETLEEVFAPTPAPATAPGGPCFNKCFVELVKAVKPEFFGADVADIVTMFLDQFPQCSENKVGVAA
jgi:hypothetical protein